MKKKALATTLIAALIAPAVFNGTPAVGSVAQPVLQAPAVSLEKNPSKISSAGKKIKASFKALTKSFSRFRPVPVQNESWAQANNYLSKKTTIEEIYDEEMSQRLRNQYQGAVLPFERAVSDPARRASTWEIQRYEQSRKDLANWTMKEIGKDQLKDFVERSKKNFHAVSAVASVTGGGSLESAEKTEQKELTEEQRIARAHQADQAAYVEKEEEVIPTRLRAKLNLLKAYGHFTFTNPIVTTSVEARAGSGDNLAVELNKDFKSIEMNSKLRYGVDQSLVVFHVNKKISRDVSLDLNSERWTGSKRGSVGEKSKDSAKVVYSVSF